MPSRSRCRGPQRARTSAASTATSASGRARTRPTTPPARDGDSVDSSLPGTNRRAITREASACRTVLVRRSSPVTPAESGPAGRPLPRAGARSRAACCNVDTSARVDSAPWFSLRPSGSRPSQPPPLTGSIRAVRVSLSPVNHPAASRTAPAQRASPVRSWARAQASASAATSMGCWSKPGPVSPGPRPPTGTTDRCPSRVCTASSQSSSSSPRARRSGRSRRSPAESSTSGTQPLA